MIRSAEYKDLTKIVEMGKAFSDYAKLNDKGLSFDEDSLFQFCSFLVANPMGILLIAEDEGKICGSIAGIISPWMNDFSKQILVETWFWTDPTHNKKGLGSKMLAEFESQGKYAGATHCVMVSLEDAQTEKVQAYYIRKSYELIETHFIKEL